MRGSLRSANPVLAKASVADDEAANVAAADAALCMMAESEGATPRNAVKEFDPHDVFRGFASPGDPLTPRPELEALRLSLRTAAPSFVAAAGALDGAFTLAEEMAEAVMSEDSGQDEQQHRVGLQALQNTLCAKSRGSCVQIRLLVH